MTAALRACTFLGSSTGQRGTSPLPTYHQLPNSISSPLRIRFCRTLDANATESTTSSSTGGGSSGSGGSGRSRGDVETREDEVWDALRALSEVDFDEMRASVEASLVEGLQRLQTGVTPPPQGFPPGPGGESSLGLLRDPLSFLIATQRSYGDVVGLVLGGQRVVLVSDPQVAREVLVDRADCFVKEGTAFFPGSSLAGNGLLVSDGDIWRRQRKLSNPAFRKAAVEGYAKAMCEASERFVAGRWKGGGVFDLYSDCNELTLQVVTEALFGADMREGEDAVEIAGAIRAAFEFFARRAAFAFAVPEWVPSPDNLQYNAAVRALDGVVYRLISSRRELLKDAPPGRVPQDLLESLLLSEDESGAGMEDEALRDELMTLLVAGQETSAIVLAWASALLAYHPKAQDAVRTQVEDVLRGRPPTVQDIRRMPALEAVLLEAMRLLPPAYLVGRCASQDVQLAGGRYSLPKGSTVLVSPYLMHRDPRWWTDRALKFVPSRWSSLLGAAGGGGVETGPGGDGASSSSTSSSGRAGVAAAATAESGRGGSSVQTQPSSMAPAAAANLQSNSSSGSSSSNSPGGGAGTATAAASAAAAAGAANGAAKRPQGGGGGSGLLPCMGLFSNLGPNGAYLPFGAGPRNCIGTGFAMVEVMLVMAAMVQRFEVQPPVPEDPFPSPAALITLRPDTVRLRLVPRQTYPKP